jgi:hypothetical protein
LNRHLLDDLARAQLALDFRRAPAPALGVDPAEHRRAPNATAANRAPERQKTSRWPGPARVVEHDLRAGSR